MKRFAIADRLLMNGRRTDGAGASSRAIALRLYPAGRTNRSRA
jgi:hypothetical protein